MFETFLKEKHYIHIPYAISELYLGYITFIRKSFQTSST